jgi:hypothetical protein
MPTQHGICTYKIEGVWEKFEGVWEIFANSWKSEGGINS